MKKIIGFFVIFLMLSEYAASDTTSLYPKVTVQTNIPFFYRSGITIYNSAGQGVIIIPESRGYGFVAQYRKEKERDPAWLWLRRKRTPVERVVLEYGESFNIPLHKNLTNYTIEVPITLKVIENGEMVGFYNQCYYASPNRDSYFDLNFTKRDLKGLKYGYIGNECGRGGISWW